MTTRPLAIVTGASTGIGFELASIAAEQGYDLIVAADEALINSAADDFRRHGVEVEAVEADLATLDGVDRLVEAARGRPVDVLCANAGRGLGRDFLGQEPAEWRRVIDTNITGTIYLIQKIGRQMRDRNAGRILITGSIAGFTPGAFNAVYNGTKAFIDSFSYAIANELKDTAVTVTCLMPGATETEFFERADMLDTKVGTAKKDDPAKVAKDGWEAMLKGDAEIVSGLKNKATTVMANVTPSPLLAEQHRKQAEPGTATE